MKHQYKQKYNNIEIRQIEICDLEYLRKWRNTPSNCTYLSKLPYITTSMQEKWYYDYLNDENEIIFAIEERDNLKQIVGSVALYNISSKKAEVGKILIGEPKAHGLKVGVNALNAVMLIARKCLKLEELYLHVYKDNIPANIVYQQVGFSIVDKHLAENKLIEYTMAIKLEE